MQYVAYYRVSTKGQGESGLGLDGQKAVVQHFASGEIVAEYTEVASGKSLDRRPQLEAALALCVENGYTLIVAKADRLSRNVHDATGIVEKRLKNNFVACDCPDPTALTIIFWIAQRERELISIRTKAALAALRVREGKQIINGAPKGVDTSAAVKRSGEVRRAAADAAALPVASLVMDWRADGYSMDLICRKLDRAGYKTPRGTAHTRCSVARVIARMERIQPSKKSRAAVRG
jgi:DNA invertase Pin-like site-specific DNA recombinase